jgi:hypothetical protein
MIVNLEEKLQTLLKMAPVSEGRLPLDMPKGGVYLFTEFGKHLYVGKSIDLRSRYAQHCFPGTWHRHASFAICLACDWLDDSKLAYRPAVRTHNAPTLDNKSANAFTAAKARIRAMDFRFVEESDSRRQALFEIYCSVVLQIPYSDFENSTPIMIQTSSGTNVKQPPGTAKAVLAFS